MRSLILPLFLLLLCASVIVESATDSKDAQALEVFYSSLNSLPQLSGWTSNGTDPCGESRKGVTCSGSAITSIQIPGLGLNGTLGYTLSDLLSLRTLDLSNSSIQETISYQLPQNLTYFNVSRNSLSQTIGDFFSNLQNLSDFIGKHG